MVAFTKLEALGNDFVLVDARERAFNPAPAQVRALADRRRGIGCDQLLIMRAPENPACHCLIEIHNADGGRAEQCGNGMRAVALWLHQAGEMDSRLRIETAAGEIGLALNSPDEISAELGIPASVPGGSDGPALPAELEATVDSRRLRLFPVSLGNPHLVVPCDSPPDRDLIERLGKPLSRHERLPGGANVSLAGPLSDDGVDVRVWERGAGPTPACGSGACAVAVALIEHGLARSPVKIRQPGGTLVIDWQGKGQPVALTGPARRVFDGSMPWPPTN